MRFHKMVLPFFTTFFLLATLGTFSLCVGEELIKGKPILTGEAYQIENLTNDWSDQELWVWTQISKGEIADFNKRYGIVLDPKKIDPEKPEEWPENRILTPRFLETILLHEPYRGALTRHGVQIVGAWFKDKIDLSNATLAHPLWLEDSRFDSKVDLSFLETNHSISFVKSTFTELVLIGTKIGSSLNMSGSKCIGQLTMDQLEVGGTLFMRVNAEFTKVKIFNVKIGSNLEMDGSQFTGKLHIEALEVTNSIFMRFKQAKFPEVVIYGAKIGGNLELSGGTFESFILTSTSIGREFRLSSVHKNKEKDDLGAAKWLTKDSKLKLLNTKVGILQDSRNSWPGNLELEGFTYDRLGNFITDNGNEDTAIRDSKWLKDWMEKQKDYSPQPYEHLAKLLRQDGRKKEAREILFAGKSREHGKATEVWYYLWLTSQLIFIGYGYRIYYAFFWVLGLVTIGTVWLGLSKQNRDHHLDYCGLAYTIDMLLPIIHLRKKHYDIDLEGRVRVYFYVHKILGYVLALFIITGLTGIVK